MSDAGAHRPSDPLDTLHDSREQEIARNIIFLFILLSLFFFLFQRISFNRLNFTNIQLESLIPVSGSDIEFELRTKRRQMVFK